MTKKRIAAIAALVLIGGLYLVSLILAFIDSPFARSCLMSAMFGTIVVPAIAYGYLVLMGHLKDKPDDKRRERPSAFHASGSDTPDKPHLIHDKDHQDQNQSYGL